MNVSTTSEMKTTMIRWHKMRKRRQSKRSLYLKMNIPIQGHNIQCQPRWQGDDNDRNIGSIISKHKCGAEELYRRFQAGWWGTSRYSRLVSLLEWTLLYQYLESDSTGTTFEIVRNGITVAFFRMMFFIRKPLPGGRWRSPADTSLRLWYTLSRTDVAGRRAESTQKQRRP